MMKYAIRVPFGRLESDGFLYITELVNGDSVVKVFDTEAEAEEYAKGWSNYAIVPYPQEKNSS